MKRHSALKAYIPRISGRFLPAILFVAALSIVPINTAYSLAPPVDPLSPATSLTCGGNPNTQTEDIRGLDFATSREAGEHLTEFLQDSWDNNFLPALREMMAEINANIVEQSFSRGALLDAKIQNAAQRYIQDQEIEGKKRFHPNETTCVATSQTTAMMDTDEVSVGISSIINNKMTDVVLNKSGGITERGSSSALELAWTSYENIYCDETANGSTAGDGYSGCAASGSSPNIDINIEQFLLKDTIDLSNTDFSNAIYTIGRNLLYPGGSTPIPSRTIPTVTPAIAGTVNGQVAILHRRHLAALRQVPQAVFSGIVGRRAPNPASTSEIADIRTLIGVTTDERSNNPSYNEIMLVMTKERFFTPNYYGQLANTPGALEQEQTMIDTYTSMQLQDIYDLQEQINALAAVKASIKFNEVPLSNAQSSTPKQ